LLAHRDPTRRRLATIIAVGPRVSDDPPGRISKRGYWLQFDAAQWPGYESAVRTIVFEVPETP
jgi:hypothetical protein